MNEIFIHCQNPSPAQRRKEPVRLGVPFTRGVLKDETTLNLLNSEGKVLPLQAMPLARWVDGSVKWLECDFVADVPESGDAVFRLKRGNGPDKKDNPFRFVKMEKSWQIDTGAAIFDIDTQLLRPFFSVRLRGAEEAAGAASEVHLSDLNGHEWDPLVDNLLLESSGPVRTTLFFSGGFRRQNKTLLLFEARLHLFAASARASLELRLHNPRAACHPANLWDLGDPASVFLREWTLTLALETKKKRQLRLHTGEADDWHEIDPQNGGLLYQESSGGKCWQSAVHRNRDGYVPMTFCGWRLYSGSHFLANGLRAQPLLWYGQSQGLGVSASIDYFWQRFPKAVALNAEEVSLSLFPAEFPSGHELQGGEQVTETLRFDFAAPLECKGWGSPSLDVRMEPETYRDSGVFPEGLWEPADQRYASLTQVALDENSGFFAKREIIDEYGWRNFGDLYADHESVYWKGEHPLVSHYNNQYDVLYSFYRLYLAGCDPRWGELGRDLAAHYSDIDFYHTDEDREEYCQGLFWHTDHYLDAGLSTHRMASREHLTQKNPAFCGGGPAAEHCYSSGLALHYFLTGDPRSRDLVLSMADWCWRSLCGPQTIGAAVLRATRSLSWWWRERGSKIIWPRYPFSRGTGNCLNALLDAFEISNDRHFLLRSSRIIRGTVHPADRPEDRDLLNAEDCWSYNVFLVALTRFLHVKHEWNELDSDYRYARDSLLTYARWMAAKEYPYLEKPDILEYPNETWAGQDLRKSVILLNAANYAQNDERALFLDRARFFQDAGFDELMRRETSHYTRPLVLVLQNGWAIEALAAAQSDYPEFESTEASNGCATKELALGEVIRRSILDFLTVITQTGPGREWRWLKTRLKKG